MFFAAIRWTAVGVRGRFSTNRLENKEQKNSLLFLLFLFFFFETQSSAKRFYLAIGWFLGFAFSILFDVRPLHPNPQGRERGKRSQPFLLLLP
jgi:hypothetical protein